MLTVLTGARTGLVCDAFADDEKCRELARLGERDVTFTTRRGSLRLLPEVGLDNRCRDDASFAEYCDGHRLHAFLTTQQGDVVRIADWARRWEVWTSAAFLTAYLDRAAGLPFLPADDQQVRQLLAAFLLDATLDELRHYVDRWPERVAVLLQAA